MRLIDMKRQGLLCPTFYKKLRKLGHQDDLNVSVEELQKKLGVSEIAREP